MTDILLLYVLNNTVLFSVYIIYRRSSLQKVKGKIGWAVLIHCSFQSEDNILVSLDKSICVYIFILPTKIKFLVLPQSSFLPHVVTK